MGLPIITADQRLREKKGVKLVLLGKSGIGKTSLLWTLNPDTTPYIFFVADGTGGHAFAVTLEEHNVNVAKWRAIEASQAVPEE